MKRLSRTRLFLLEMLVNLLVFCVCAAICLMTLSQAYSISAQSRVHAQAQQAVQNAAAAFRAAEGRLDALPGMLSGRVQEEGFSAWYDRAWRPVSEKRGQYQLTIRVTPVTHNVCQAKLTVFRTGGGKALAALTVRQYTGSAVSKEVRTP